jgi:hypothetical protein
MELTCQGGEEEVDLPDSNGARRKNVLGLKSVTNITGFKHIFYYPIVVAGLTIAILEIGYENDSQLPKEVLNPTIISAMEQLSS